MENKSELISIITNQLINLANEVKVRKNANDQSWSISSETLIMEIMNVIFDTNLHNRNADSIHARGFDLIDNYKKVVVQVTSSNSSKKVLNVASYFEEKIWHGYKAYIVILGMDNPIKYTTGRYTRFSENGTILSLSDLYKHISALEISKIVQIVDLLKYYLGKPRQPGMLSTSVLNASPYTQKITFANYTNRYCLSAIKCVSPNYHDTAQEEISFGELDLQLHSTVSELWATRIKEFPVAIIANFSLEEVRELRSLLIALNEFEGIKISFLENYKINQPRDIEAWAKLSDAKDAVIRIHKDLMNAMGVTPNQINAPRV